MDESGKGDIFGPLTTACVATSDKVAKDWVGRGLKESKLLKDPKKVFYWEQIIKESKGCFFTVRGYPMEDYNKTYIEEAGSNMNTLLAMSHADCLNDIMEYVILEYALLDQFSVKNLTKEYLHDKEFDLRMQVRAESDPIVAAASILARAEYLRSMDALSSLAGFTLSRGASKKTKEQLHEVVSRFGVSALVRFTKTHFRPVSELLS